MSLAPGIRLGVYEVTALIGAGGMGEVYRARDTRLNRDVAIKILPSELTPSAEHLARFEREAQVLASLNHPNVAHIYGLEESTSGGASSRALVMELVDGEDLSQRLRRGAVPVGEALRVAIQIAEGLAAAHEHGVIHRDLKPANIKLRDDGTVKILDFGLAKALDPSTPSASVTPDSSPTMTSPAEMTRRGVVLGTAAYMSPEQARGRIVDRRADIWSFGVVLYEMLTGVRAFAGDTVSDAIASILKTEVDLTALPADTPFLVRRLVRNCLQKDIRQRTADMRDARIDLQDALVHSGGDRPDADASKRTGFRWSAAAVSVLAAATIGVASGRYFTPAKSAAVIRSSLVVPEQLVFTGAPALSPDGQFLAYVPGASTSSSRRGVMLLALADDTPRFLEGTERGVSPFWSPDGRRLGFAASGKLKTIDVVNGLVTDIADVVSFFGAAWGRDGTIVFSPRASGPLFRVAASGGAVTPFTTLDETRESSHRWPFFFPDGDRVGYIAMTTNGPRLVVRSISAQTTQDVMSVDGSVAFVPPDTMLTVQRRSLVAQRFDPVSLEPNGASVTLAQVWVSGSGEGYFSAASLGDVLIAYPPLALPRVRLAWVTRQGGITPISLPAANYADPSLSPDGQEVALTIRDDTGTHIWVYNVADGSLHKRTFAGENTYPIWSPDGRHLTFTRGAQLIGPLMRVRADGTGEPEVLVNQPAGQKVATSWSADGSVLAFQSGQDVMVRENDGRVTTALNTPAFEREGRFAPSGRWLAYRSDETGSSAVFVQSYPPGQGKWQISTTGGAQPMWSPNGRELFFKNGNRMMVVPVQLEPTFKPGTPRVLFEMPLPGREGGDPARYGVAPDGNRFLVLTTDSTEPTPQAPHLQLIVNWRTLLRSR